MKIDAVSFSFAGDKYIGRRYSEMDCQAFVERCMRDCGLYMDLAGSNAWYREVMKHGWVGSPEGCIRTFGQVPKGALLFILKTDGKEPGKYRGDGIGNASHIGICIQRHDGAINSSSSKGQVCYSKFANKSINGGWNRVGLYDRFSYGKSIDWMLEHIGIGEAPPEGVKEDETMEMEAVVTAPRAGETVNMRKSPGGDLICRLPDGERVKLTGATAKTDEGEWSRISARGMAGWMMSQFLTADDSGIPAEDPAEFTDGDTGEPGPAEKVKLELSYEACANAYPFLKALCEEIEAKVGRG